MQVVSGTNEGYGLPADIWSLGCTVLEMLTGRVPYADFEPVCVKFTPFLDSITILVQHNRCLVLPFMSIVIFTS